MSAARAPLDPDNATPVPDGEARQDGTVASHLKVPSGTHVSDIESPARQLQSELEYRLRHPDDRQIKRCADYGIRKQYDIDCICVISILLDGKDNNEYQAEQ